MTLMNELKTLIDISAGTRLPQYEPEIFSDNDLTEYYLRKLCCGEWWHGHADSSACMVYHYAKHVMKSRWPEAEHLIATGPAWAYNYAKYVMKSRWPEAEAVIAASRYRGWYNQDLGTNI